MQPGGLHKQYAAALDHQGVCMHMGMVLPSCNHPLSPTSGHSESGPAISCSPSKWLLSVKHHAVLHSSIQSADHE